MSISTHEELQGIQHVANVVAIALKKMRDYAKVGMSTRELDDYGFSILKDFDANSAPKKDYNFPGYTCISINHEVCHGIPKASQILKEGDLINIDVSAELGGYYGDNGCSFVLGEDHQNLNPLVTASKDILMLAISKISSNVKLSDIGELMETEAKKRGFQVIRNICGHGIGKKLHESPREIPCFRDIFNLQKFKKNSVIALETFISTKAKYVYEATDGWTLVTNDNSFVAQHEHTILVTDNQPKILTLENGI